MIVRLYAGFSPYEEAAVALYLIPHMSALNRRSDTCTPESLVQRVSLFTFDSKEISKHKMSGHETLRLSADTNNAFTIIVKRCRRSSSSLIHVYIYVSHHSVTEGV